MTPLINKKTALITSERYKTSRTIPLTFQFSDHPFLSSKSRLQNCSIEHITENGIYLFDRFFSENEARELRAFSSQATFSREIFAKHESKGKGEEPARAMDNKEKWMFFSNPPLAAQELFKLLSFFANGLNVEITTLPWELYDEHDCAPAFATNLISTLSHESEELGKHADYNPEEGLGFAIPILYAKEENHPSRFINGSPGMPWLVTIMLYATSEDFLPEYGLGSVFCKENGETVLRTTCTHGRFILFEGNIVHGIARSSIPDGKNPWRVSYVFKLIFNPRKKEDSIKQKFFEFIQNYGQR